MNKPKEWKKVVQSQDYQGKFSSHCFINDCRCPFALCITRANSTLNLNVHQLALGSSLLKIHVLLSFQIH
jgi:hypothetical protein